jgi:hypothetical protein
MYGQSVMVSLVPKSKFIGELQNDLTETGGHLKKGDESIYWKGLGNVGPSNGGYEECSSRVNRGRALSIGEV